MSIHNTDKPARSVRDDILGVKHYIDGLTSYIMNCETPMTVAIQGDWGSGKTSFMNMINEEIEAFNRAAKKPEDTALTVWFNTWQFSQFNMSSSLAPVFIGQLLDEIKNDSKTAKRLKSVLRVLSRGMMQVAENVTESATNLDLAKLLEAEDADMAMVVKMLKDDFEKCVKESLGIIEKEVEVEENGQKRTETVVQKRKYGRLVIFVDDLDRLSPGRAVELLEVLKLFLDCEACIFVLAIDYEVVIRGVSDKYGREFGEKKGRSFFDKIIQVPFKMPVGQYEIERFVDERLTRLGFDKTEADQYADLIASSIGYNPRSMKRMFNALELLTMVYGDRLGKNGRSQLLLFAVLCLQISFEEVYNLLLLDETVDLDWYNAMLGDIGASEPVVKFGAKYGHEELIDFLTCFMRVLCHGNPTLKEEDHLAFQDVLSISGTTLANSVHTRAGNGKTGIGARYAQVLDADYHDMPITAGKESDDPMNFWNNSKIRSYTLFGKTTEVKKNSELMVAVLAQLYTRDEETRQALLAVKESCAEHKLKTLFLGVGQSIQAPKEVPGTDLRVESKFSASVVYDNLCKLLKAMQIDPNEMVVSVKLAKRAE